MKNYKRKQSKLIFVFLFSIISLFFYSNVVKAHALDVSIVNFLLPKCESNNCKMPVEIKAEYILSWPEAAFLINKKTNDNVTDFTKLNDYQYIFNDYFKNKTRLFSSKKCNMDV